MAHRLSLNALRTFEAVASHGSFSRGAEALHVTPAAVSSQIRALEAQLGQPLFARHGRRIALTAAGQALLPGVQRGLAEISGAVRAVQEDREGGVLNVSTIASFLQKWMTPRLPDFYRQNPQIDLRINADVAPVDFATTDFHAAIRFGRGGWESLRSEKMLDEWTVPVCAPSMLAEYGPVDSVDELRRYPLLNSTDEPWDLWLNALGGKAAPQRGPVFDDSVTVALAAEQGQGLALARWSLVAGELASGRLVQPLPLNVKSPFAYYFVAPEHYFDLPKVARFRAWLVECCQAFADPPTHVRVGQS